MSKIRNIVIFVAIGAILILIYVFAIKPNADNGSQSGLVSSPNTTSLPDANSSAVNSPTSATSDDAKAFLALLLNVQDIKLNDAIFQDKAFQSLNDSSVPLTPDPNPGRPNPFAQFGNDGVATAPVTPTCTPPQVLNTTTNTCVTPVVCPAPKILDAKTNTCIVKVVCTAPRVLDAATNTCIVPVPNCVLPKILNTSTNECIVPIVCTAPKVRDDKTNTCVAPAPTCTDPKILDLKTKTCVNKTACTAPKILDPLTNTCIDRPTQS